jgi:hypothetical protein
MTTTDPTKLADDLERGAIRCEALLASDNDIRLAACAVADIVRNNLPTILDALRRPTPPPDVAKLRELVEEAYAEGFSEGVGLDYAADVKSGRERVERAWDASEAKAALASQDAPSVDADLTPDWVAEKGHRLTADGYKCERCNAPAIDLYEDGVYGPVRNCAAPPTGESEVERLTSEIREYVDGLPDRDPEDECLEPHLLRRALVALASLPRESVAETVERCAKVVETYQRPEGSSFMAARRFLANAIRALTPMTEEPDHG